MHCGCSNKNKKSKISEERNIQVVKEAEEAVGSEGGNTKKHQL